MRHNRALGLAVLIAALAPAAAWAQFSTPYDPDFAPKKEEVEAPPEEAEEPEAGVVPGGGPFLLLERPDASRILLKAQEAPAPAFESFELGLKPFEFTQAKWNKARQDIEEGRMPSEGPIQEYAGGFEVYGATGVAPLPPPPELELPAYGTSLSITGRKVISFNYSEKHFLRPQTLTNRPQDTGLFDINQQLQLRMQGKVGPKITVNVDYDDTKLNKQDISVVYQGDPNEVVQNVSFGDIDLSLPASEFVSYNKQLFGIRADVKYKGWKSTFIGSRTKGTTKIKQFTGNTNFNTLDLLDVSYIRRQYYDLAFGNAKRLPIRAGTERIFLSLNNPTVSNVNQITATADDLAVQTSTFTGIFTQLAAGQDYTIDYAKGIVTFRNPQQPQFVIAVDFIDATGSHITVESTTSFSGGTGNLKLIKTPADVPISTATEVGFNRELKTVYSMGQTSIVADNGRGNFILRVLDQNRNETGSSLNPVQKYPDTITVDFPNGLFRLNNPFSVGNASPTIVDPDVYAPTPISKRLLHVEFFNRFKTFTLEPQLVPQSDVVILDGAKLIRNVDYFIDYDAGFLTFFNEDRIRQDSTLSIAYEVAPFANISNTSLLGARASYDFNKYFSMGSTLLYQSGTKNPTVPQVTELAQSLLTYEADTQVKSLHLGRKATVSFSGEFAQSRQNMNLNGFALIDNMEGIKQEDQAPILATAWQISSNPGGVPTDPSRLSWINESIPTIQISPSFQGGSQVTQQVLTLKYDFTNPASQEQSIVFPFSISGLDMSQKTLLQVVMLGDGSGNDLNFHLGGINEDADGSGILKTENVEQDGILHPGEDVGWCYQYNGNPCAARFGAGNGVIDTDDLNRNARLDPADFTGGDFGYMGGPSGTTQLFDQTTSSTHTFIDFGSNQWRTFLIPLNISSATANLWTAIKQLRISVRHRGGGSTAASALKFAHIGVVGNTWLTGQPGDPSNGQGQLASEGLTVSPINNIENPNYVPIFNAGGDATAVFNDLYGSLSQLQQQSGTNNLSEQALQMEFVNMTTGTVVFTKRIFPRAIDVSQHSFFNFLLFGNADPANQNFSGDKVFFLRAGNDTNFWEIDVPLTFTGWRKFSVHQVDASGGTVANTWTVASPGSVIVSSGSPNLSQIAALTAGVKSVNSAPGETQRGRLYLDEIYLSNPIERVGNAHKVEVNFDVPGWAAFGLKNRQVDRNFQTPTSVISNQNNEQDSAFLNFTHLQFFPMSFNVSRNITETPSTVLTGGLTNTVNLLQQGKVTTWNGTASGNFNYKTFPRLSLGYSRNRIEYELLTRTDDRANYNTTLSYGVPVNSRFLPKTVDLNYSYGRYLVNFDSLVARLIPGNADTSEVTQTFGARMTFVPWFGTAFNPNFNHVKVSESRNDISGPAPIALAYPKSLNQTAGFNSNFRLARWLNPQLNYSINTVESTILNVSTFIVNASTFVFNIGDIKTVNRNANGQLNVPIAIADLWKGTRLLRSMNIAAGYQIQDGDVWNQVEQNLRTEGKLWVRSPLRPQNPAAALANQTLRDTYNSTQRWSPVEAYNIPGRLSAFKTLALSNNLVWSIQRSEVTGTFSKTITRTLPDAVASISQLEKLWFTDRWMANTQMNFKYSAHNTLNVGTSRSQDEAFGTDLRSIILKKFDSLLSYNNRTSTTHDLIVGQVTQQTSHEDGTAQVTFDYRKFRFTPKVDYANDKATTGGGIVTQNLTTLTPSVLVRADLALPKGLKLPGMTRPLLFTNRIIWTTTTSLALRRSPITQADNSELFSLNTSADYELAKNLRMTINGALSRLWHLYLKEEEFYQYQLGSTLTFQF